MVGLGSRGRFAIQHWSCLHKTLFFSRASRGEDPLPLPSRGRASGRCSGQLSACLRRIGEKGEGRRTACHGWKKRASVRSRDISLQRRRKKEWPVECWGSRQHVGKEDSPQTTYCFWGTTFPSHESNQSDCSWAVLSPVMSKWEVYKGGIVAKRADLKKQALGAVYAPCQPLSCLVLIRVVGHQ